MANFSTIHKFLNVFTLSSLWLLNVKHYAAVPPDLLLLRSRWDSLWQILHVIQLPFIRVFSGVTKCPDLQCVLVFCFSIMCIPAVPRRTFSLCVTGSK